jgi:hypothetical protein
MCPEEIKSRCSGGRRRNRNTNRRRRVDRHVTPSRREIQKVARRLRAEERRGMVAIRVRSGGEGRVVEGKVFKDTLKWELTRKEKRIPIELRGERHVVARRVEKPIFVSREEPKPSFAMSMELEPFEMVRVSQRASARETEKTDLILYIQWRVQVRQLHHQQGSLQKKGKNISVARQARLWEGSDRRHID